MADLIHLIVVIFIVLVFVVGPAILKFLIRQGLAKGGGQQQARRPGPGAQKQPADEIKNFLSAIGIQVEEPKPPPKPARPPQPAQPQRTQQAEAEDEAEVVYEADQDEVKHYLESIGVKVESKEPKPRPAPAPSPAAPQRPAARPRPVAAAAPPPLQARVDGALRPARAHEAQPPRKARVQRRVEPAAPVAKPAPRERVAPKPGLAPSTQSVRGSLGRLGAAPTLAELRRAVILSEIISQPDFDRLPYERMNF